jgi:hypothetical protein
MKKMSTQRQKIENPFLGPDREMLWDSLKKNAKPMKREDLLKIAKSKNDPQR